MNRQAGECERCTPSRPKSVALVLRPFTARRPGGPRLALSQQAANQQAAGRAGGGGSQCWWNPGHFVDNNHWRPPGSRPTGYTSASQARCPPQAERSAIMTRATHATHSVAAVCVVKAHPRTRGLLLSFSRATQAALKRRARLRTAVQGRPGAPAGGTHPAQPQMKGRLLWGEAAERFKLRASSGCWSRPSGQVAGGALSYLRRSWA